MKFLFIALFFFQLHPVKLSGQNNTDAIIGKWINSGDKNLEVEVFKTGREYKGKVIWFDDTDDKLRPMKERRDFNNPDKILRERKILGLEVLHGLHYDADGEEWRNGTIYDPSSGKTWNAKVWIASDGSLKVRGYWHISLLGQTMSFYKLL